MMSPHRPIKDIPWYQRETVRVRGYTVAMAVLGLIVLRDWISNEEAGYILMAMAAIFGVYGVESSRSSTTPDTIVRDSIIPAAAEGRIRAAERMASAPPTARGRYEREDDDGIRDGT